MKICIPAEPPDTDANAEEDKKDDHRHDGEHHPGFEPRVLRHNVDLPLHLDRKIYHELHGDNKRNTCKRRGEKENRMRSSLGREGV